MSYNNSNEADSNYPTMSNTEYNNAPWNQNDEEKGIEVTVSITLSKTFKIYTSNYTEEVEEDEDGKHVITEFFNLEDDVEQQVILPNKAYEYIPGNTQAGREAIKDLKDWEIDDFCVNEG